MTLRGMDRRALLMSAGATLALLGAGAANAQSVRYGIIEIGASGVRAAALSFSRRQLREPRGARERGGSVQTGAFERFERNVIGSFNSNPVVRDAAQVEASADAVADAIGRLQREFSVPRSNITVVASSSVERLSHRPQIEQALTRRGVSVDFVTARQEAEYLSRWIIPPPRWSEAVTIDIGSGNTKGGYITGTAPNWAFQAFEIPDGSRSLVERANTASHATEGAAWNRALVEAGRTYVDRIARQQMLVSPGLSDRPRAYLVGGAAWAMASVMHPAESVDEATNWVSLQARDISAFREAAYAGTALNPSANAGLAARLARLRESSPEAEQRARDLLRQVGDAINPAQMKAGAEILSILSRRFRFAQKEALFFSKEGLYAWPTMYLIARQNLEAQAAQ